MTPDRRSQAALDGGVSRTAMSCCSSHFVVETIDAMKRLSVIAAAVAMAAALATGLGRASAPSRVVFTADLAPSFAGEIYRVDPNGQRVDLSNSPFQDFGPVVS